MKNFIGGFPRIWMLSGKHFIKSRPQAVNVRPPVNGFGVLHLLRRKICGGADHDIGFGQFIILFIIFRNAQVGKLDFSLLRKHDVIRLYVPVNNIMFFRSAQRGGDCLYNDNGLFLRQVFIRF